MALPHPDKERRARAARAALNDAVVMQALDEIVADAFAVFLSSGLSQQQDREIAYFRSLAASEVKAKLEAWATEGKT